MMHINIDIQNPSMILKKFQNPQNYVIDVTKARGLTLLRMV